MSIRIAAKSELISQPARQPEKTPRSTNVQNKALSARPLVDAFEQSTRKPAQGTDGFDAGSKAGSTSAPGANLGEDTALAPPSVPGLGTTSIPASAVDARNRLASWSGQTEHRDVQNSDGSERVEQEEKYVGDDGSKTTVKSGYERDKDGNVKEWQEVEHTDANGKKTKEKTASEHSSNPNPLRDDPPSGLTIDSARGAAAQRSEGLKTPARDQSRPSMWQEKFDRAVQLGRARGVNPQPAAEGSDKPLTVGPKPASPVGDPTGPTQPRAGGKTTVVGGRPPRTGPLG